ncbi:MAG: hypothetical protein KO464_04805 [Candidatus Methanofastidiosum sp.]|nr:hypothetical protein [Methanofastidiosum sp.]
MSMDEIIDKKDEKKDKCRSIEIDGNPSVEEIVVILSLFNFSEVDK